MSGHSKWAQIKRQKGAADTKKGALFTKIGNTITVAAREHGADPNTNFKLRLAIDRAKAVNMPKDNIEKAIKRGTGELAGSNTIEEIIYEAFGPAGSALLIEVLTDNKNRALGEIKTILKKYDASLAGASSVLWMFERKGVIALPLPSPAEREKVELQIIESGANDFKEETDQFLIYTDPEKLSAVQKKLNQVGLAIASSELEWVAKNSVTITDVEQGQKLEKLLAELSDCPDVNNTYINAD